ncbi:15484_t:CDS:1 [Cetraspora pellucida]|uniref:15484_t:CDS:1 n=1 Tax=Cetraspora pellucida TaxID=1433469 RepID=A0A9N9IFS5_9GLOM|nr:15484_t:CDS:1 [Cetraspora pellucida]
MAKYFSKLTQYLASMESYSLCEGHYNWIIAKKSFIDQLKKKTDPILLSLEEPVKKKLKFSIDDVELQVPKKIFTDFGIQVDLFKKACVDFESQVSFSDPMCEILQRRIDELEKNNKQLLSENETLKKKLSERFTNQEDCIHSIIEIAKKKRSNLCEDAMNLIKN